MINIKIEKFEGPLSLLLKMIEKEKLGIAEISLVKIADQYIEYIKNSSNIKADDMADFLVIAAKLLYIKSKALLPYLFPNEEDDIEELEMALKMFKEFLEASTKIEKKIAENKIMFSPLDRKANRAKIIKEEKTFYPPQKVNKDVICEAYKMLLFVKKPQIKKLEEKVVERKINIEDRIVDIEQALLKKIKISFNDFVKKAQSKTEVVVSFLALLELMKQNNVVCSQEGLFQDIQILSSNKK